MEKARRKVPQSFARRGQHSSQSEDVNGMAESLSGATRAPHHHSQAEWLQDPQSQQSRPKGGHYPEYELYASENDEETQSTKRLPNNHRSGSPIRNAATNDITSREESIRRIEELIQGIVEVLDEQGMPVLCAIPESHDEDQTNDASDSEEDKVASIRIALANKQKANTRCIVFHNLQQCRLFCSTLLVLSFCHSLLIARRTTSIREVYYYYVTYFRSQRECDRAIVEATKLLRLPRTSLGLYASPKGWFCGCVQIIRNGHVVMDGRAMPSKQGAPITREWLVPFHQLDFTVDCLARNPHRGEEGSYAQSPSSGKQLRAKCILVIEKEGVYNRFSEDRLFEKYPCILVTGKGFPDIATRSLVHTLHNLLHLPVYGVADCNPYGVMVLQTYQYGSELRGVDGGSRYSVPIQWLGLRPSQIRQIRANVGRQFFSHGILQKLTKLDHKRMDQLLDEDHRFHGACTNEGRYAELEMMKKGGYKMELEALNWLGMDFITKWLHGILVRHENQLQQLQLNEEDNTGSVCSSQDACEESRSEEESLASEVHQQEII